MSCGTFPDSTCKKGIEIETTINNTKHIGVFVRTHNQIESTISSFTPVEYHYTWNSGTHTHIPSYVLGNILIKNNVPFVYNINSYVGCDINLVLWEDVFTLLSGGRITDLYCTVWSGGRLEPAVSPTPTATVTVTVTPSVTAAISPTPASTPTITPMVTHAG